MSDIKRDIQNTVKAFTKEYTSSAVKESTKKLFNELDEKQKEAIESNLKNISDEQLELYLDNAPYFKNALENTVKSVSDIPLEKAAGSFLENLQSIYEATFVGDIAKISSESLPKNLLEIKTPEDIKRDVKDTVKAFTKEYVSGSVKESTKKLLKNLDKKQKVAIESKLANMSCEQLERYLENNPDFKSLLENTIKSVNDIPPEKAKWSLLENLQSVYEATSSKEITKIFLGSSRKMIPIIVSSMVVLIILGYLFISVFFVTPLANFSSNVTEGYSPLSVHFMDQSENADFLSWDFGDGATSTEQNPTHTYSLAGTYKVILTVAKGKNTNSKYATINVLSYSDNNTQTITWAKPANITYGARLSDNQLNAKASVPGTYVYAPALGTVLGAGMHTLHVDFTPTNTTNNSTASKEVTINVLRAIPIITWNDPANITYGIRLSKNQLNANASVPGTYVYTPATGTILSPGKQILHVDFTPDDTLNYSITSKNVTINVLTTIPSKPIPTITWSEPANITYGTRLNETQLNAQASVPGTFIYNPEAGSIPSAGTHTLHVDFAPTDTTNYATASKNVSITVLRATPTITWSVPVNITVGTALSEEELNAEVSVPRTNKPLLGTYVYTPPEGNVLSEGTHILHVDFTPGDIVNYSTASKELTISVVPPRITPTIYWNPEIKYVTYGEALSELQLNAYAYDPTTQQSVSGQFVSNPPEGTEIYTDTRVNISFIPTDIEKYNTASMDVLINFRKATPEITWNPADIAFGAPLSDEQLNATASYNGNSVLGTYNYSPQKGSVPYEEIEINLHVDFTPDDTTNYTIASKNVTINYTEERANILSLK